MADQVTVPIEPTDEMIDAGLRVTLARLALPGSQLTQNRQKMRLRYKAMCAVAPPVEVEVVVPDVSFRMAQDSKDIWDAMGHVITFTRAKLGDEMAFSVLLSRLTREMRRLWGLEAAMETLHGLADTMPAASQNDQ